MNPGSPGSISKHTILYPDTHQTIQKKISINQNLPYCKNMCMFQLLLDRLLALRSGKFPPRHPRQGSGIPTSHETFQIKGEINFMAR